MNLNVEGRREEKVAAGQGGTGRDGNRAGWRGGGGGGVGGAVTRKGE